VAKRSGSEPRVSAQTRGARHTCVALERWARAPEERGEPLAQESCRARDVRLDGAGRDAELARDLGRRQLVAQSKRGHLSLACRHRTEHALDGARDIVRTDAGLTLGQEHRTLVRRSRTRVLEQPPPLHAAALENVEGVGPCCTIEVGADVRGEIDLLPVRPESREDVLYDVFRRLARAHESLGVSPERRAVRVEHILERRRVGRSIADEEVALSAHARPPVPQERHAPAARSTQRPREQSAESRVSRRVNDPHRPLEARTDSTTIESISAPVNVGTTPGVGVVAEAGPLHQ